VRFLVNENISRTVIQELRKLGHDVLSVKESMVGARDDEVLARAREENRLIVTQDKDFGELALRRGLLSPSGVILLRLAGENPESDNQLTLEVLSRGEDFPGNFVVAEPGRVRIRPLPPPQ
jgi:predicted nuclease of predicted toxin-antitoxin system